LFAFNHLRTHTHEWLLLEVLVALVGQVAVPRLHVFIEDIKELLVVAVLLLEEYLGLLYLHKLYYVFYGVLHQGAEVTGVAQFVGQGDGFLDFI